MSFPAPDHTPRTNGLAQRASAGAAPQWLTRLNPEQRLAVETVDGAVLVLAGAGTGKTRVLTTRIAHLLATGRARPAQILAVTFTNKAAREMRERIGQIIGQSVEGMPWLGTFHSIGRKILARHAEIAGLTSNFTVLDTDDQLRLLKQIIEAENIDIKRWPARQLAQIIDNWKNRGQTPQQVPSSDTTVFANGRALRLYQLYQDRLKTLNCADFGDLLVEPIRIFLERPDVLAEYQQRFKYMLVDEYQDTNVAQYLWLRLLAGQNGNICCVGDDDQSIYGWRGAEVDNILRFELDFPGAVTIKLERNYRSTHHILAAASHLISHNEGRLGKTLYPAHKDVEGDKISLTGAWDSEEEARLIGEEIEQLQRKSHSLNQIAILVRASFQMREFEDRFVTLGLPYRVIGGPRFYERAEIRDAMAYLRITANPADGLAFERIVNVPKRGLGDATLKIVHDHARTNSLPLLLAATQLAHADELKPKPRTTLRELTDQITRWHSQIDTIRHTELAQTILDESGYTAMWQAEKTPDAAGRLENLKELIRSMDEFENLTGFLEHVSLVMDVENKDVQDCVNIMTLHSAKGLEFDTVFLPGWEEGLFPHQRALDEQGRAGLEEERRLAYVGITRAKHRSFIHFAQNRRIHGQWTSSLPSRFLDELPETSVEVKEAPSSASWGAYNSYSGSRFEGRHDVFSKSKNTSPGFERGRAYQAKTNQTKTDAPTSRILEGQILSTATSSPNGAPSSFTLGDRVFHQKFGYGHVREINGNKMLVAFDKAGEKRVIDSFLERH